MGRPCWWQNGLIASGHRPGRNTHNSGWWCRAWADAHETHAVSRRAGHGACVMRAARHFLSQPTSCLGIRYDPHEVCCRPLPQVSTSDTTHASECGMAALAAPSLDHRPPHPPQSQTQGRHIRGHTWVGSANHAARPGLAGFSEMQPACHYVPRQV